MAFETPSDATKESPAEENREFFLAPNRSEAMKRPDTVSVLFEFYFTQSLRGLSVGAPVEFRGINIGEVKAMNVEPNEAETDFRFPVTVAVYPERLLSLVRGGTVEKVDPSDVAGRRARWDAMVARGLRGQLKTGSLLTGQLYVALEFFPDAPKAEMDWTKSPPVIPAVPGGLDQLEATVAGIARKIGKMPLEEIGTDLRQNLATLNRTLNSADKMVKHLDAEITPVAKSALEDARKTLNAAEKTLAADSPTQHELQEMLRELNRTAQSLRLMGEYLERHPEALIHGKKEGEQ